MRRGKKNHRNHTRRRYSRSTKKRPRTISQTFRETRTKKESANLKAKRNNNGAVNRRQVFSIKKAHQTQLQLSCHILFRNRLPRQIRLVAGVDAAYLRNTSIGAATVLSYNSLRLVEAKTATCGTRFPYIPTLLSFRELPPVLAAFRKLQTQPDVVMVDGQGYAHPYHCGFACHLGLKLGVPTIGVAKNRLIGDIERSSRERDIALLKFKGETVGAVVTTRTGSPPVFVSVGHMISLRSAVNVVKHCILQNRIPEPIMKAHEAANFEKRKIQILSATNRKRTK